MNRKQWRNKKARPKPKSSFQRIKADDDATIKKEREAKADYNKSREEVEFLPIEDLEEVALLHDEAYADAEELINLFTDGENTIFTEPNIKPGEGVEMQEYIPDNE